MEPRNCDVSHLSAPWAEKYVSIEVMSRAHRRFEEAWKGRKSRRYRLQGLDQGCWKLGSHMGCREVCREREGKKRCF